MKYLYTYDVREHGDEIHMWGKTPEMESILLRIFNVKYYVYIEIKSHSKSVKLDTPTINEIKNKFERLDYVHSAEIKSMYHFHRLKHIPVFKVSLESFRDRYKIKSYSNKINMDDGGVIVCSTREYDQSLIVKFLTDYGLSMNNWHEFEGKRIEDVGISKCQHEYVMDINVDKITLVDDDHEVRNNPINLKVLAFDIETYCHTIYNFPNATKQEDEIMMITMSMSSGESLKNYALVQKHYTGEEIEDTEVYECSNEYDLIMSFQRLIVDIDPDIITGYNIYGFDIPYIHQRLVKAMSKWINLSRLKVGSIIAINKDFVMPASMKNNDSKHDKNVHKYKNRSMGNVDNINLLIPGRLTIDVFQRVKETFKNLRSYSLDSVGGEFLGEYKLDVSFSDLNKAFRDYGKEDYAEEVYNNAVKYGVQDSILTYKLFNKLNIFINLSMYSHITTTSIPDIIFKGSSTPVFNAMYRAFKENNYLFMGRRKSDKDDDDPLKDSYQGAYVLDPNVGIHSYATTLDLNSLYPNIIITYNICPTTYIPDDIEGISDEDCHILEFDDLGRQYRYRFLKKEGIVPKICRQLIEKRSEVRKRKAKDEFEELVNYYLQLALKINVNTIYGAYGIKNHQYSFIEGARSVTAMGRQTLERIKDKVESKFARRVIYGDTDSIMFVNPEKTYREAYEKSEEIKEYINNWLPGTLKMDLEKIGVLFLIGKKKYKYRHWDPKTGEYEVDKNGKTVYHSTGADSVRRDRCKFQADFYEYLTDWIMEQKSMEDINDNIFETVLSFLGRFNRFYNRPLKANDLYINIAVNDANKSQTFAPTVMLNRLKKEKYNINSGERVDTIIVKKSDDCTRLGDKMYTSVEYEGSHNNYENGTSDKEPLTPDLFYYLVNRLSNSVNDIFNTAFKESIGDDRTIIQEMISDATDREQYEGDLKEYKNRINNNIESIIDYELEPMMNIIDDILENIIIQLRSDEIDDKKAYIKRFENILITVNEILWEYVESIEDEEDPVITIDDLVNLNNLLMDDIYHIFNSNTDRRNLRIIYENLSSTFKNRGREVYRRHIMKYENELKHVNRVISEIDRWGAKKCWHIRNIWLDLEADITDIRSIFNPSKYNYKTPYERLHNLRGRKIKKSKNISEDTVKRIKKMNRLFDRFIKSKLTWFGPIPNPMTYLIDIMKAKKDILTIIENDINKEPPLKL